MSDFKLAQFSALRDEILKRLEMQHQLLALALIVSGTLLTIGLADKGPAMILLLSPILIMFIAIAWSSNNVRIGQAGKFIKEVEGAEDWEHYWRSSEIHNWLATGTIAAHGIFNGAQLVIIAFALLRSNFPTVEKVLIVIDVVTVVLTFVIVQLSRRPARRSE